MLKKIVYADPKLARNILTNLPEPGPTRKARTGQKFL